MFRSCWVMSFALLLSACGGGGGGSGGGNLPVNFSYSPEQISTFTEVDLAPQLQGMDGNATNCTVASGALPAGLSLGSNCDIIGAATQAGTFNATIALTTPNYSGSLSAPITLTINATQLIAMPQMPTFQAWQPASSTPIVELNSPGGTFPGNSRIIAGTVAFKLASGSAQLPQGLTLDQNTGALDGMAQSGGTFNLQITATITNNSGAFTLGPTAVALAVYSGPPLFNYGNCCVTVNTNTPVSFTPTQAVTPPNAKTFSYSATTSQLPPGVTLNPTTGVISGTPVVAGNYGFNVTETIVLADGTNIQAQTPIVILAEGLLLVYPTQPAPAGVMATQASVWWPTAMFTVTSAVPSEAPICEICTNYTYSLMMAPGSTAAGISASSPLPSWITISADSGEVTINPAPAGTALGQYNFYVVLKGTWNGAPIVSMTPFNVSMQSL